jgi:UPF0716 protein FxsA
MIRLLVGTIVALPFLEIAGFVVIGGRIGLGLTLLWLLAAGMLGMALIRHGGLNALSKLQLALNEQREPGHSLIDGAVMVTAGLLLIVPGFVSDLLALILVLPITRNFLLRHAASHFETRIYRSGGGRQTGGSHTVIEGEFEIIEPEDAPAPPSSQPSPDKPVRRLERPDDPS